MAAFWIIAGINGAGKSTIASLSPIRDVIGDTPILNPDLPVPHLRRTLDGISSDEANLAAVVAVETIVESRIKRATSIGVETVLSSGKFERHLIAGATEAWSRPWCMSVCHPWI